MVATVLNIGLFAWISWISFKHFNPESRSFGNTLIRATSLLATLLMLFLAAKSLPHALPHQAAAISLSVISASVFSLAISETRSKKLDVVFTKECPHSLVHSGIYARVRNPMYLSYLLYWIAWIPLADFSPPAFIIFGLFTVTYTYAAKHEERVLERSFGQEYAAYFASTGRFLPKVI